MIVKEKKGGQFFDLIKGDTLIENEQIETQSVDLILTDLPYGTVKDIKNVKHGMSGKCEWDVLIDTDEIYKVANRILRKNGKMVLFAQQPFTNELMNKAIWELPFNYNMIWVKDHFANALTAKKAPLNYYEDVLIFSKTYENEINETQDYLNTELINSGKNKKDFYCNLSVDVIGHTFTKPNRYSFPTEKTYLEIQSIAKGYFLKPYRELEEINEANKTKYPSTFNLWEGNKYKSNILKYKKDYNGYHPTQKPILLLEDLIKTFSNDNDLVVDLTMGSGSTGIACRNTNRNFIGIEKDDKYFDIAQKRINGTKPNPNNFEKVEAGGLFSFTDEPDKLD